MTIAAQRKKVIEVASSEVGYFETPKGSNITKFGEWYGLDGKPWCAIFVSWVLYFAKVKWPYSNPLFRGFASCYLLYDYAVKNKLVTVFPEEGDIVLFNFNRGSHPEHVGFFVKWVIPWQTFETIEGNTSGISQTSGGEVAIKKSRSTKHVVAFVNIINPIR